MKNVEMTVDATMLMIKVERASSASDCRAEMRSMRI
jgi:hypothetical protein